MALTPEQRAAKRVRDRNYRFSRMPRNRQRVAIARDVLEMIGAGKIKAQRGVYMRLSKPTLSQGAAGLSLKEFIALPKVTCRVCAIGAVFAAAVGSRGIDGEERVAFNNKLHGLYSSAPTRAEMVEKLGPYFDEEELARLEHFFER